jgi:hypothetical protein
MTKQRIGFQTCLICLIVFVSIFLVGCIDTNDSSIKNAIVGKWQCTIGGGHTETIQFFKDAQIVMLQMVAKLVIIVLWMILI